MASLLHSHSGFITKTGKVQVPVMGLQQWPALPYQGPQDSSAFETRNHSCVVPPLPLSSRVDAWNFFICLPFPRRGPLHLPQRSKWPLPAAAPWSGHTVLPLTFQLPTSPWADPCSMGTWSHMAGLSHLGVQVVDCRHDTGMVPAQKQDWLCTGCSIHLLTRSVVLGPLTITG